MLKLLTISAIAMAVAAPVSAATLLAYDTTNGVLVAPTEDLAVTGTNLTRGVGITQNSGTDFNSRGWTETDLFGAVLNGDYLEWGLSSTVNLRLDTLEIAYDRSPTGPIALQVFAQVNGGSFVSIFSDTSIAVDSEINSIDLAGSPFDFAHVNDVTFRLFGWGATSSTGTFDIETDNVGEGSQFGIAVLGVVPLPAGLPLLAGGLALLGLMRRKR